MDFIHFYTTEFTFVEGLEPFLKNLASTRVIIENYAIHEGGLNGAKHLHLIGFFPKDYKWYRILGRHFGKDYKQRCKWKLCKEKYRDIEALRRYIARRRKEGEAKFNDELTECYRDFKIGTCKKN